MNEVRQTPVLTSWKEIAGYMGKGVRTVQRWEQSFGLPVRRASASDHTAVLAVPQELDLWIAAQPLNPSSELEALRREVAELRARNQSLSERLQNRTLPNRDVPPFEIRSDVSARSSQLLAETARLRQRTSQLVNDTRSLRNQLKQTCSADIFRTCGVKKLENRVSEPPN